VSAWLPWGLQAEGGSKPRCDWRVNVPKLKKLKATAKKYKINGTGRVRRRKVRSSHLCRKKSDRAKRALRKDVPVPPADVKRIERLLGKRFQRN
jgi:large subunit ribosomal protein L35